MPVGGKLKLKGGGELPKPGGVKKKKKKAQGKELAVVENATEDANGTAQLQDGEAAAPKVCAAARMLPAGSNSLLLVPRCPTAPTCRTPPRCRRCWAPSPRTPPTPCCATTHRAALLAPCRPQKTSEGVFLAPDATEDRRTDAEKKLDEHHAKSEAARARKEALKSHREKINELNARLASETEHFDLFRISYTA